MARTGHGRVPSRRDAPAVAHGSERPLLGLAPTRDRRGREFPAVVGAPTGGSSDGVPTTGLRHGRDGSVAVGGREAVPPHRAGRAPGLPRTLSDPLAGPQGAGGSATLRDAPGGLGSAGSPAGGRGAGAGAARPRAGCSMSGSASPLVSVVVPCRNEERYIAACLDSILASDYPRDRLEVLVVDGLSDDRTREILGRYTARHPSIRRLDNPQRITPTALNVGIRAAEGDVVMRMDAHVLYPSTYVSQLVAALEETGADCVGGVIETLPADESATARAIALGLSHPLGVGNSYFRIGSRERRWADAVSFGCYRRDVFNRIGLFDEELLRDQDDE